MEYELAGKYKEEKSWRSNSYKKSQSSEHKYLKQYTTLVNFQDKKLQSIYRP